MEYATPAAGAGLDHTLLYECNRYEYTEALQRQRHVAPNLYIAGGGLQLVPLPMIRWRNQFSEICRSTSWLKSSFSCVFHSE
jgi:hypothetical protein